MFIQVGEQAGDGGGGELVAGRRCAACGSPSGLGHDAHYDSVFYCLDCIERETVLPEDDLGEGD